MSGNGGLSGSLRRMQAVARLELRYLLARPSLWIWAALLLLLPLIAFTLGDPIVIRSGSSASGGVKVWVNSEAAMAGATVFGSLMFTTFFAAVLAGLSLIRDDEARVGDILDATPLTTGEHLWGKFGGVLAAFFVVQAAATVATMALYHLVPYPKAEAWLGPFVLQNYLRPLLIFGLPNLIVLTGFSFAVGGVTRQPILIFVLPFALIAAFIAFNSIPANRVPAVVPFIDPIGIRWLMADYLYYDRGAAYYNHTPIAVPATFVLSRILCAVVGLLSVWAAQSVRRRFQRNPTRPRMARGQSAGMTANPSPAPPQAAMPPLAPLAGLAMRSRRPGIGAAAMAVARNELRELLRQPGLYLFVPIIVLFSSSGSMKDAGMFSTYRILTSGYVAQSQYTIVAVFVSLLLLAYTVESLERDRATRFASLQYAQPARTASLLLGKFLALCLVAAVPLAAVAITQMIAIHAQGYGGQEGAPGPFLLLWGGMLLPGLLFWILLVMAVYVLVGHHRVRAYTVSVGLLLLCVSEFGRWQWVSNPFLIEALRWSDLAPLELDRFAAVLSRVFVLGASLFVGVVAVRGFERRAPDSVGVLSRLRPGAVGRSALRLLPLAALAAAPGIWLGIRVAEGQAGTARAKAAKDYWRRNLSTWEDAPEPRIEAADVALDLHPERQAFAGRGTLTLVNRNDFPLRKIAVTPSLNWRNVRWTVNGAPTEPEDRAGLRVFTPPGGALAPGRSLRLGFSYEHPEPGPSMAGGGDMEFVLPSAIVLTSFTRSFVPTIGYDPVLGLDRGNRHDADDGEAWTPYRESHRDALFGTGEPIALRLAVTGPADFVLNGVGDRVSDTMKDGRRTVVWEAPRRPEAPIHAFNLVGGRGLAVRRGKKGTAVYYYPGHAYNVAEMVEALDDARTYYGQWFAPYRWPELKLTEFPDMAGYAQSFPTNISFGEGMGFLTRSNRRSDATDAYAVTAHEAAHQWWGHLVVPGKGPGGNVLSEGLAHYSAGMLVEQVKGWRARESFLRTVEDEYIRGRSADSEQPLARLTGDQKGDMVATYDKGGWVFVMMNDMIGRENMRKGLRAYVARYRNSAENPSLSDFLAVIRPFAPNKRTFDYFADEWFRQVVLPEFRVSDVAVRPAPAKKGGSSQWTVTCRIANIGTGGMNVPVVVEDAAVKHWQTTYVPLDGGAPAKTITMTVPFPPKRIVVDPWVQVLQLNRKKAVATVPR